MLKTLTALTFGVAMALSAAASACEYHKQQAQASAAETAQTAESQPAVVEKN